MVCSNSRHRCGSKNLADTVYTNQPFTFPVGDASNYTPLETSFSGTTVGGNLKSKVNNVVHPTNRHQQVFYQGIGISMLQALQAIAIPSLVPMPPGDANGTPSLIKGAVYDATSGLMLQRQPAALLLTGSTDDAVADFTGTNFCGKVNFVSYFVCKAITQLQMKWIPCLMHLLVQTGETSALTSPYNAAPFNAQPASVSAGGFFLAKPDIVDWLCLNWEIQLLQQWQLQIGQSAFIKKMEPLLGTDGTSQYQIHWKWISYFCSSAPPWESLNDKNKNPGINVYNSNTFFWILETIQPDLQKYSHHHNVPLKLLENTPNGPNNLNAWGMWEGDINQDGLVKYNLGGNDRVLILTAIGGTNQNATASGYLKEDVNLNGQVKYNLWW